MRRSRFLGYGAFALVFFALLWFPWPYHERLLDDGWSLALARFMQHGARAGVDYVFTYGPLGYLAVPALVPELFAIKYIWTVAFAAVGALAVVRAAWLLRAPWQRVAWVWLALLSLPRTENRFHVVMLLVAVLPLIERDFRRARLAASTAFLAVVSLIKFTYFGLAGVLVVLLVLAVPPRERVAAAAGYLGAIVVAWLGCAQSLLDLPRYVRTSLFVSTGYSEAMSLAELLQRYRPALTERDYVLLERSAGKTERDEVVLDVKARVGERVVLPTEFPGLYTIAIAAEGTFTARVHGLLLRVPRLPFDVETEDGQRRRYELVGAVAATPFLVSPVLTSSDDLSRIYAGEGVRATAVSIPAGEPGAFKYYEDEVGIRVTRRTR